MLSRTPFNEAEAIIAPFWNGAISPLSQCDVWTSPEAGVKVWQNWFAVSVEWIKTADAGPLARLRCRPGLRLYDEDEIIVYAALLRNSYLTIRVRLDGQEQTPIAGVEGADMEDEWAGPIRGRHLEALEVEIGAIRQTPFGTVSLMWIGVANREARRRMLARRKTYSPDWPGHLLPAAEVVNPQPQLGLFFGSEDLSGLRAKAATPLYAPLMERMRREAADACRHHPPEPFVGTYIVLDFGKNKESFKRPSDDRWTPLTVARTCAFVGLLDENQEMLRYAARCALAMAHCDTWFGGMMGNLIGSRWQLRSFWEAAYARTCLRVWDWAGSALTPEGRAFLRHTINTKALSRIQQDAWEHKYIHHCNQGPVFFAAWIQALIAIGREWPHARDMIPIVERYLLEALGNYIEEDGGASEGPTYVNWTMTQLDCLYALARERGQPFNAYLRGALPARFFRITEYCRTMLASPAAGRPLGYLDIGDSGHGGNRRISGDTALMMYLAAAEPLRETVLAEALAGAPESFTEDAFGPGLSLLLALGPRQARRHDLRPPVFSRLSVTGQLASFREAVFGPVRFQLCGNMARAHHSHEDSGSFILEACGEELAIDRGILNYTDPRHHLLKYPSQHNLLLPVLPGGAEPRQTLGGPAAVVPEGRGDERTLSAWIDTTAAWSNGLFRRHVRRVDSPDPTQFTITDEAEFEAPQAVSFNLHSRFPIVVGAGEWLVHGERATLRVRPKWDVVEARVAADGVDGAGQSVNRLCLISAAAGVHQLITMLEVMSSIKRG